jgi:small conductance mechanosensitive channel
MSDFFIDKMLQIWEEDINLRDKNSNRGILRIPTISNALKGICLVLLISTGIILSLGIFDFPIATILAGAGIIGFAISFGSQSLIKDVISGVINLFNDSYAVGDFVIIANDEGLVEDLNLFVTRLRSSNGDLITIPNGSVGIVRNQTKDWSRVDYSIQISYDADIQQALGILRQVAEELYHDSQWHSLISEPPDLKGVEDLSHLGVRLRVWLKTKPGEQWIVARELRLRLKSAFEAAGISIGIPQKAFLFQNSGDRLSGE